MEDAVLIVRDYLQCNHKLEKSDIILVLWSSDMRVATRAAELYCNWYAPLCITTGNSNKVRTDIITLDKPEADMLAEVMIKNGVSSDKILIENQSTNTGENVQYAYKKITDKHISSIILVHKPYSARRALATFEKQRPDKNTVFFVTSPKLTIEEYCEGFCYKDHLINMMVGNIQRIIEYPKLWFQSYQEVPENVISAYEILLKAWFTKQLIKS